MTKVVTIKMPYYRYDAACPLCFGSGIAHVTNATTTGVTISASTPCSCGKLSGYDVYDFSNVLFIR